MGNYEQLKQSVSDVIKTNGNQEITGSILQNVLLTIISSVGANATFAGIATPTTNPGTPDGPVFYLASEGGAYTNFGAIELQDGLSVLLWNGTWSSQQIFGVDDEPTAGSDNLVKSGGVQEELALGAVYDVSAKNPTAGVNNDGKWESLSALLSDANLSTLMPTPVRKRGMSIKFVQSSDNKYVQYRLAADNWSTDTEDWVIADEGIYVENPEFAYTKTDKDGKILWAIKIDGSIYYGAGVPQQIKDYIEEKISLLSLDEYEDIVTFLSDYLGSDTTLKVMIDSINERIPEIIGNPEFLEVTTDSKDKVLEGIQTDGTKVIGGDLNVGGSASINGDIIVKGSITINSISYKVIENPEYVWAIIDNNDKVLCGLKTDGKFIADIDGIDERIPELTDSPEYLQIIIDSEGKILAGRTTDGAAFENVGFSTPKASIGGHTIENIEDSEGRSEITTDAEGKIISYRDSDGVKHEVAGIETNHLELGEDGLTDLEKAIKEHGFSGDHGDWSDSDFVEIPIPDVCALVNFGVDSQAEAKGVDIPTFIEFWDKNGNYFKKPIELNAQGSSSMEYHIKNQAIDFTDGSKIKFGNWPAFDSFHIKKYFIDVFRGQCIVAYWLTEQVYQTKPYGEKRPWNYLNSFDDYDKSNGSFSKDFESGAMAHPDGFPVHVFFNGKDAGIYAFNVKKDRSNYNCKKTNQKQIILDGILGDEFFMCNSHLENTGALGGNIWQDFEIRNPKIDKDIDGNKYDGDYPKEPSDDFVTTKNAIKRLTTALTLVNAESTVEAKRTKFKEFFNVPFLIDYELISQVIYNYDGYRKNWIWCCWDGKLWCPTSYDMDSIFGQHWNGASYESGSITTILGTKNTLPTGNDFLKGFYTSELRTRYKELRDNGIFTVDNIVSLLEKWVNNCGYDNLKSDIEDIVTSPYIENGSVVVDDEGNPVLIPNTPSYRDSEKEYVYSPQTGGWYNSIQRVKNWLTQRIAHLDSYYNYN